MADSTPKSYSTDPALYLYTSLTSGSSHVVTATSRMETILKANRIPFKALDIATDEKARMLWGRRAGKDGSGRARKIPGLVQMGLVIGDLEEVEDWNEYGELKEHVTIIHDTGTPVRSAVPTPSGTPSKPPLSQENKKPETATAESSKATEPLKPSVDALPNTFTLAMRQAGQEAAQKAKDSRKKTAETFHGIGEAKPTKKDDQPAADVPPTVSSAEKTFEKQSSDTNSLLQSPTSSAWKRSEFHGKLTAPRYSANMTESLQSPNSTAWKPTNIDLPITMHRGSSVSLATPDEIKKVEEDQAIAEEEEEEEEN